VGQQPIAKNLVRDFPADGKGFRTVNGGYKFFTIPVQQENRCLLR
jgi:hypothetical protein